jgi:hypothetical protein
VEHSLRFGDLHAQYLALFEGSLAGFLADEGCSFRDFHSQCQDALDDKYAALFEEHQSHGFVGALLASLDYSRFFGLMAAECRRQETAGGGMRK